CHSTGKCMQPTARAHIRGWARIKTIQIHIESDKSLVFRVPANANTPVLDSPYTAYSVTAAATLVREADLSSSGSGSANTPVRDSPYTAYSVTAATTVLPALKDAVADGGWPCKALTTCCCRPLDLRILGGDVCAVVTRVQESEDRLAVQGAGHVLVPPTGPANAVGRVFNVNSLLASSLLGESLLASPSSTFPSSSSSPSRRPLASRIVASARPLTPSVNQPASSFSRSTVSSKIQRCSHVVQGIRAVESFDTSFELDPQAKEVLVYLLSSDVFLQQVATQPGVPAGITGTEFTGELFTPVPWSPTTRFGMPQELEKYNEDKDNCIIINVPNQRACQPSCQHFLSALPVTPTLLPQELEKYNEDKDN
ncbi:unnamed protein product, partial [Closterium sp. NIES-65]